MKEILRIIPVLFIKNGLIVRSQNFYKHQFIGNVIEQAKRLNDYNVDELVYIDECSSTSLICLFTNLFLLLIELRLSWYSICAFVSCLILNKGNNA